MMLSYSSALSCSDFCILVITLAPVRITAVVQLLRLRLQFTAVGSFLVYSLPAAGDAGAAATARRSYTRPRAYKKDN